jgi:anthranilate synthase/aminodeoxychorismate synthase-like glutamine amidotransferase
MRHLGEPSDAPLSVVAWPLNTTLTPQEMLRLFRDRDRLVGLVGSWASGGALVAFDPCRRADSLDVLDEDPPAQDGDSGALVGGGWFGVLGYQLGRAVERLPDPPRRVHATPACELAYYDHVLRFDRRSARWWFEALYRDHNEAQMLTRYRWVREQVAKTDETAWAPKRFSVGAFDVTPGVTEHRCAISRVLSHIHAGDIFQANLCVRLDAVFEGDPLDAFLAGVEKLMPAYAAFVRTDTGAVASLSPELFLERAGRSVRTAPIKGTAPLASDPTLLGGSLKDRAENVMIVDLMRSDLGRVSVAGSVRVPSALTVQRHAGVWHLVSEVEGLLRDSTSNVDLLRATFPPGSVTGAPKIRAMELINEIESTAREAYTGAIGWIGRDALELNVAIRTFEFKAGTVWLGVGGGIVADSDPDMELDECFVKARPLLNAIGAGLHGAVERELSASSGDKPRQLRPVTRMRDDSELTIASRNAGGLCYFVTDGLVVIDGSELSGAPGADDAREVGAEVEGLLDSAGIPVARRNPTAEERSAAAEVFRVLGTENRGDPLRAVPDNTSGPLMVWLQRGLDSQANRSSKSRLQARSGDGVRPSVLLIDNYDSFVFNLAQYCEQLGADVDVVRNDAVDVGEILSWVLAGSVDRVLVSPGPGAPRDAGVSVDLIRRLPSRTPVLGVCLGHQAIAEAFGAKVIRAPWPVHGRQVVVHHDGAGVFEGLHAPVVGARYHSLVVDDHSLSETALVVSARSPSGLVMGIRHLSRPVEGLQIHPESILTRHGHHLIRQFLSLGLRRG